MITLEQLMQGAAAQHTTLDRPLDHLVACHTRIDDRLRTMERTAEHLATKTAEALEAARACIAFFDSNGVRHTEDEEQSLFPRLLPRLNPTERIYITTLEQQHQEVETVYAAWKTLVDRLGQASQPTPEDCTRYTNLVDRLCTMYRQHIASENDLLITLGRRECTATDLAAIAREMKLRRGQAV
jgi:iron-sulfur cluster repair protein YtfE (RIC family)